MRVKKMGQPWNYFLKMYLFRAERFTGALRVYEDDFKQATEKFQAYNIAKSSL